MTFEEGVEGAGAARAITLGVLGGIASGKSEVARRLAGPGGCVIDADALARGQFESEELRQRLVARWGSSMLGPDGCVDRAALARRVFSDPEALRELEGWIHPLVRAKILEGLAEARAQGAERIVLDVPLLLENDAEHGLARMCDALVFVHAPAEERERRAVATRGWPPGEVARREAAQLPLADKRRRAQWVIQNDGNLEQLDRQIQAVLAELGKTRT